ncbi:hypothetical protein C0971_15645 [Bacillus methanolicus]|uniref:hypothetical protein n=1 Tax=Bacillus methanolicus TaxID=1471 RepID=UPI00200D7E9A|nr:hypothetical protein [Bacillus methanolicus]UQD53294.1 hypothetical protein C0971_15645 [Bacillus methanolicus]
MFLLDNIVIILAFTVLFFGIFTFLNICTFSRDALTALFLTFIFFDLFFKMPFKAVNEMYEDREKILKWIEKNAKLTDDQKQKIHFILQKRTRLFFTLYRSGCFSYSGLMVSLTEWYKNKPFTVRFEFVKQKKKSYESKYISHMKKDISGLEAY